MNRHVSTSLALGLTLVLASACSDKDKKPKTAICQSDKDCKEGHCFNGKCVACVDDSHCLQGTTCKGGACIAATATSCTKRSDCKGGEACKAGVCVKAECTKNADCPEPKECQQGICIGPADMVAKANVCAVNCEVGRVPFGFDAHILSDGARAHLQAAVLPCLKKAPPKCMLRIVGRTDNRGTGEYNLALGDRRGRMVMKYMVRLGVDKNRMVVMPIGKLEANGSDEPGYARDREARFEWFESALPKD